MIDLNLIFVALYFLLILAIGIKTKSNESSDNFILAGRNLSLPFFIASLVATWYGSIVGVGEFIYSNGIFAWLSIGLPYYVIGLVYAIVLAKKVRIADAASIPEQIKSKYGTKAAFFASIIILLISIPSSYLKTLGILLNDIFGIDVILAMVLCLLFTYYYLQYGGLNAGIKVNFYQFILMFAGFIILLAFNFVQNGGLEFIQSNVPSSHLDLNIIDNWQVFLVWLIVAFQTFIDPSFHQRCAAAKSPKTARNGILISILFWISFDFLTLSCGLYSRALLAINPSNAYTELAKISLPNVMQAFFYVSILATVMSTFSSYYFISAVTIGNDFLSNKLPNHTTKSKVKIGLVISGLLAILISSLFNSVLEIIYTSASIAIPGLILPLIISYSTKYKISSQTALKNMIYSSSLALIWVILKKMEVSLAMIIEPMIPAITFSIIYILLYLKKIEIKE